MAATFTQVTLEEMHELLTILGYRCIDPVTLPGVKEFVYGKILKPGVCLRVYTSIQKHSEKSAGVGDDAIRCCVVKRVVSNGLTRVVGLGKTKRVHRVVNWRENLTKRIQQLQEEFTR